MKAFRALKKPFEALQRSMKINILANFFFSPEIEIGRIKIVYSLIIENF